MSEVNQEATKRNVLQGHLDRLLESRELPKTICPSEVARALNRQELASSGFSSWRESMSDIRILVSEMRSRGEVEVLQKGSVLEGDLGDGLENVTGPIRVRKTS
ncbi:hypothetical protein GLAREA_06383 [Glarea lozoyensis ATCC 20868]|uniref:Uncharacterized protein n=1 Tax=Glarea lozoyensis (strain ATCC 20868 / MF5171) TaxID=1116229 RepID=S3D6J7_GLAL2|nr:uncharacterized protein GLAREA_06383 [Glarea lozoyensis ATCC 20868]EPE33370.1 hypothetical protein GLAREA_06383 [Glarea lozoyensis ATCC 20868]